MLRSGDENIPCLTGKDAGDDDLTAGFENFRDVGKCFDENGAKEIGDDDVVFFLWLPFEDVLLGHIDSGDVVAFEVFVRCLY